MRGLNQEKFQANAKPAIFAGYRLDTGPLHKGAYLMFDYRSLRDHDPGYHIPNAVPRRYTYHQMKFSCLCSQPWRSKSRSKSRAFFIYCCTSAQRAKWVHHAGSPHPLWPNSRMQGLWESWWDTQCCKARFTSLTLVGHQSPRCQCLPLQACRLLKVWGLEHVEEEGG